MPQDELNANIALAHFLLKFMNELNALKRKAKRDLMWKAKVPNTYGIILAETINDI